MKHRVKIAAAPSPHTTADMLAGLRAISDHDRAVLDMLSEGATNRQIVKELEMSATAVLQAISCAKRAYREPSRTRLALWWAALREDREASGGTIEVTERDRTLLAMEHTRRSDIEWRQG